MGSIRSVSIMPDDQAIEPTQGDVSAPPTHIAIVGCGFTGSSTLFQLVDRYPIKRITVFEASGVFGPGYPYQTDECPDYLINNTTGTMGLTPDSKRGFSNWLRLTGLVGTVDDKGHLPRALFGEFLVDAVRTARTSAAIKGIELDLISTEVSAIREVAGGVEIRHQQGKITADVVLLTTGRCPNLDRFGFATTKRKPRKRYFATHVSSNELDLVDPDATVYVLGTSLSAYDVVNRLFSPASGCVFERQANGYLHFKPGSNKRRIILGSRAGRLKKIQSQKPMKIDRRHFNLSAFRRLAAENDGLSVEVLASLIQKEAVEHSALIDWASIADPYAQCEEAVYLNSRAGEILAQATSVARGTNPLNFLVDLFADAQLDIWDGFAERLMKPEDERYFRSKLESAFLTYGAPCPMPTAERLLALHRAGVLAVRAGVMPVELRANTCGYLIQHRFGQDKADIVIDATGGVDRTVDSVGQPKLIANLAQSGLMRGYRLADRAMPGAAIDMKTFRMHGAHYIYALNMWLWGPGFSSSSASLMATLAKRMLDRLFDLG